MYEVLSATGNAGLQEASLGLKNRVASRGVNSLAAAVAVLSVGVFHGLLQSLPYNFTLGATLLTHMRLDVI